MKIEYIDNNHCYIKAKLRFNKNCKKSIEDMRNATYDEKVYERTGIITRKRRFQ